MKPQRAPSEHAEDAKIPSDFRLQTFFRRAKDKKAKVEEGFRQTFAFDLFLLSFTAAVGEGAALRIEQRDV